VKLILLEDDPLIQLCTQDALSAAGFEVLPTNAGEEGFALLAENPDVAAMMVDVRLVGGIDGWAVAERARETHPDMAIVYTTTALGPDYEKNGVERSVLLQKPYTLDRAVSSAREAIELVSAA
jgi:DNA-binding response OmpR family regulator